MARIVIISFNEKRFPKDFSAEMQSLSNTHNYNVVQLCTHGRNLQLFFTIFTSFAQQSHIEENWPFIVTFLFLPTAAT